MISKNNAGFCANPSAVFWGAFCCLLVCLLPSALAQDKQGKQLVVPGGPPDVYLTMPVKELLAQRKNIKPFSILDDRPVKDRRIDPESKRGMLLENYKDTQFQHAIYFIQDAKLLGIAAFSDYQGKVPAAVRQEFLSNVVKAYGQPDGAAVVREAKNGIEYNIPALLWHLPTVNIGIEITPDKINSLAPKESLIVLKMFTPEYHTDGRTAPMKMPFELSQVTDKQRKNILEPLQAAVKKIH